MNVLILGPQGSGKGTQARLLSQKYGLLDFDMGEVLRAVDQKYPEIKEYMNKGYLVPDKIVAEVTKNYLKEKGQYDNIVFDGSPRDKAQFDALSKILSKNGKKISLAIKIDIPEEESIKRLSSRRIHKKTGKIYNVITNPPPKGLAEEELETREDDKPEAIKKRLERYKKITVPLIKDFSEQGMLEVVDGMQSIQKVHQDIVKIIEKRKI